MKSLQIKPITLKKENSTISSRSLKYLIILLLIGYVSWYAYNNTTFEYKKSEKIIGSENSNNKKQQKNNRLLIELKR